MLRLRSDYDIHVEYIFCPALASQTFQQLSYANAELGQKLIRPTQTTTPNTIDINYSVPTIATEVVTTPKSSGFFSGLRNLFGRNSGATTTVRPSKSTTSTRISTGAIANTPAVSSQQHIVYPASPSQNARARIVGGSGGGSVIPSQLTSTTSTSRPSNVDDFPALSPPRRNNNNRPVTSEWTNQGSRQSTPHNDWTNIRRHGGSLPNLSVTTSTHRPSYSLPTSKSLSNIHSVGHSNQNNNNNKKVDTPLATDAEIQLLSESLFEKSTPNIFPSINVNLQGRTRSSEQTDQAPMA